MTIIYVAAGLVAGIIIGFLLGRFYTNRALEVGNLEEQVEASQKELSKYKQEMGEHLNATSSLALQMKENYDELLKQVEKASKMMQEDVVNAGSHMPFFSHETFELFFRKISHETSEKGSLLLTSHTSSFSISFEKRKIGSQSIPHFSNV